jgi:hypothetical protein
LIVGVTDKVVAFVVVQLKFTNCPTPFAPVPAMVGVTVKLVTVGAVEPPEPPEPPLPPLPPLPPELELLDPPPHPTANKIEENAAMAAALRSRNIIDLPVPGELTKLA